MKSGGTLFQENYVPPLFMSSINSDRNPHGKSVGSLSQLALTTLVARAWIRNSFSICRKWRAYLLTTYSVTINVTKRLRFFAVPFPAWGWSHRWTVVVIPTLPIVIHICSWFSAVRTDLMSARTSTWIMTVHSTNWAWHIFYDSAKKHLYSRFV